MTQNGTAAYSYDEANRLLGTASAGQAFSFGYDRNGNRWSQTSPTTAPQNLSYDVNNRVAAGNGVFYDAAGNITGDGAHGYTYDAESRITRVDGGATASYQYDASGLRVQKVVNATAFDYVYDLGGNVMTVTVGGMWQRGEVFAGGAHLATYVNDATYFHHGNWEGSERVRSDVNGNAVQSCVYQPFGEQSCAITANPDAYSPYGYAGYERDSESGLDHMRFRYYNSRLGRFMSPDPLAGNIGDPQSLNRYAYVQNNPVRFTDPLGLCPGEDVETKDGRFIPKCQTVGRWSGFTFLVDGTQISGPIALQAILGGPITSLDLAQIAATPTAIVTGVYQGETLEPWYRFIFGNSGLFNLTSTTVTISTPSGTPANNGTTKTCSGLARVLKGNAATIGRQGGIPGTKVAANSAAVIPAQFGLPDTGAALAPFAALIRGRGPGFSFRRVTEVIGGMSPIPGVPVRNALRQMFPGRFIVELPSLRRDLGIQPITLTIPSSLSCPEGLQ